MKNISLIVAKSELTGAIGRDGEIPWSLPSDLMNFKRITSGKTVVMGRKTYESIPEKFRPLPNRRNIVLTTNKKWEIEGVESYPSVSHVIDAIGEQEETYIIGGERVYADFLYRCRFLYVTNVFGYVEGDAHFPIINESHFPKIYYLNSYELNSENDSSPYQLLVYKNNRYGGSFPFESFKRKLKIV